MTASNRKNNASLVRRVNSIYASLISVNQVKKYAKDHTSLVAGVFSILTAVLVVWAWSLITAPHTTADQASTANVNIGTSINSGVDSQQGVSSQGPNDSTSVTVQKNGDQPAQVTVNGQPVASSSAGTGGSRSANTSNSNIDISVQSSNNGTSKKNSFNNQSVFVHSYSNTNSNTSVSEQSSGGAH